MIDHIVVDVEIAKTVEEVGGWDRTEDMGIAVACVWEYRGQRMRVYGPDDVESLRNRLLAADRITTFNGWKFDFPVIWGLPGRERVAELRPKSDDILRRIWIALSLLPDQFGQQHKGWGLDAVAGATLNARKIGYGGDAPKWYQAGLVQKVANYCADDVAMERDLGDFIERYGYVLNDTYHGRLRIPAWKPEV